MNEVNTISRTKRISRKALWLVVPAMLAFLTSCQKKLPQDALAPEGKYAKLTDHLWNVVFPIMIVIFILVEGLVLLLVVKYRRRAKDESTPKQIHGNVMAELTWTVIPALILIVVGAMNVSTVWKLDKRPAASTDPLHVQVIGHQWWWEFSYPKQDAVTFDSSNKTWKQPSCMDINVSCVRTANELVIPANRPVDVQIQSKDVIHSFWVPKLAGKLDATSGHTNSLVLQSSDPGEYYGQCAEFCGLSHANMRFRVEVKAQSDYDTWYANQLNPPVASADANATAGALLFTQKGCAGCHMVNSVSKGNVGPNLTHFASRGRFAGSLFVNNDENLRRWLRNPPDEKPGSLMPNLNLSEPEITSLMSYLQSLK